MKQLITTFFLTLVLQTIWAQRDAQTVLSRVALLHRSVFTAKDPDSLRLLLSDQLIYGHTDGHLETRDSLLSRIRPDKGATYTEFDAQTHELYFPNKRTAIVRQAIRANVHSNGQLSRLQINLLMVWVRKRGKWLLELRQAVKTM